MEKKPQLVLSHTNDESNETFVSLFDFKGKRICCISELNDKIVMASCHSWLLLVSFKDPRSFSLWNSNSYETINLPRLKYSEIDQYSCVLTYVPTDPKSLVILCDTYNPRLIFCKPRNRNKKWTVQDITEELHRHTLENVVSIQGIVYACSSNMGLFVITVLNSNKLLVEYLQQASLPDIPWMTMGISRYLIESCGELFMVLKILWEMNLKEIGKVLLFKMDFPKIKWVKIDSLKDRALFLGDNYSVSCSVDDYPEIEGDVHESKGIVHESNWIIPNSRVGDKTVEERRDKEKKKIEKEKSELKVVTVKEAENNNQSDIFFDILDLPFDILELIGKGLIIFDYLYFRASCREFRDAAPLIEWRSAGNASDSEKELVSPCFMLFKNESGICNIMDPNPKHSDTYFVSFPEFLSSATIHFSKNGWLLMSTAHDSFFFFNPCTRMIRALPKIIPIPTPTHLGFSSSPTSPDCIVVGITAFFNSTTVYAIHLGEEDWFDGRFEDEEFEPSNCTPVFYHKRFWFLDENGKLGVLREGEDDNEFIWEVLIQPQSPCSAFESNYIVECDGELISVFVGELGKWVKVFKLDYSEMIWLEVKSLGKHMIFVSHSSCCSAIAKFTGMENKIYFSRLCGQSLMFYSLQTKKFHTFTSEESMEDFQVFSSLPLYCGWIEPRW